MSIEEESKTLLDNTSQLSANNSPYKHQLDSHPQPHYNSYPRDDFFKNENESVDLLLKEMNVNPLEYNNELENDINDDPTYSIATNSGNKITLLNGHDKSNSVSSVFDSSPTKPLNFPRSIPKPLVDANSSSDTYTSDKDYNNSSNKDKIDTLFNANFDVDNSFDIQKTIDSNNQEQQHIVTSNFDMDEVDEFSFQTPMTSTTDLLNNKKESLPQSQQNYINTSPSKSIMKHKINVKNTQSANTSPIKKNVVFTQSNPEIHHYSNNSNNNTTTNNDDSSSDSLEDIQQQTIAEAVSIQHSWDLPKLSFQKSDDELTSTPPPPPPPHTSKPKYSDLVRTYQSETRNINGTDEEEDFENGEISQLKLLKHNNFSNLSLNEKLDLYLNKQVNERSTEMDSHLQKLDESFKEKVNDDIHNLSFSLQSTNNNDKIENPFKSLINDSEHQELRSSGSSSSSLQSLRDDNRQLSSTPGSPTKLNRGLELKDGIKGLSDEIVEQLLPRDESNEYISSIKEIKVKKEVTQDDNLDSFDKSYNNTEQSILNLLKSASSSQVALNKLIKEEDNPAIDNSVRVAVAIPNIKQELSANPVIKSESNAHVSEITGLTPQEEVDQLLPKESVENDDESDISKSSTKMSIRFHVDSDWKLEDSHDGDKEDNDNEYSKLDKSILSSEISQESIKTLAPPKIDAEMVDDQHNNSIDAQDNILANSSSIVAADITLPPVESNHYSSLEDITKNLETSTYSSFEESLSAEHDKENRNPNAPINFITIWHKQEKLKKKQIHKVPTKQLIADIKNDQSTEKVKIPNSLNHNVRKFKEVNVMSRRIVSPDNIDDLNISQFLPELSQDSGFENLQFANYSNLQQQNRNISGLSTRNVLSNIDNNPNILEPPPQPKKSNDLHVKRSSSNQIILPQVPVPPSEPKRSKFRVPTFEIKRSNSLLSPRNMYNDIFEDIVPPTIKSKGMKTLPSMDKDDVKRILNAKKSITQEEYKNVKLNNQIPKKNSVVNEPENQYDELQQVASLHDAATFESSPLPKNRINSDYNDFMYLADELKKSPKDLMSTNHIFNDINFQEINKKSGVQNKTLPEPDFKLDLDVSPTRAHVQENLTSIEPSTPIKTPPIKKPNKSPIKIGSPVRLIKKNGSVTGVEFDSPDRHKSQPSFEGNEILNNKVRESDTINHDKQNVPSTVSVPSEFSDSNHHQRSKSDPVLLEDNKSAQQHQQQLVMQDRGRLFFRVVGLKNINLPDIKDHKGNFSITLDNGVHCVKTPDYDLNSNNIEINNEFELTVNETLEFILTMKMKYEKPKGTLMEIKERKLVKSKNRFSRLFGSKDLITTTRFVPQDIKDSWSNKFAIDGSFARCYIDLSQFEHKITGKPLTFDLNCFNEWETSVQLGQNLKQKITLKPYKIAQLEVKMLYIPRSDPMEVLPTSIGSADEYLTQLLNEKSFYFEGYLHQEGGDCQTWKRRFFKLFGNALIAHSEYNHKTRAKINLSKIIDVKYIDNENQQNRSGADNKYRNFSDILLVENSFRIKFLNGEIIEFGAPNRKEMKQWIEIIESIVYRNRFRRQPWVILMMKEMNLY
ncbi:unnamed protein product [Candida verbasci]|uniref:PH domain-containing protein n=1 Tax=Candida verbasci TaxID=1227364 RepID=A0A9W4XBV5_9ASCO|nr:unnamed protein product [Candida verbasci]